MTYLATGVLVLLGGSLGAVVRYLTAELIHSRRRSSPTPALPTATLLVNLAGSFLLGLVAGLADLGSLGGPGGLALVGIGFCGALTTFSTFAFDIVALIEERAWPVVIQYVTASVLGGLLAAWAGLSLIAAAGSTGLG